MANPLSAREAMKQRSERLVRIRERHRRRARRAKMRRMRSRRRKPPKIARGVSLAYPRRRIRRRRVVRIRIGDRLEALHGGAKAGRENLVAAFLFDAFAVVDAERWVRGRSATRFVVARDLRRIERGGTTALQMIDGLLAFELVFAQIARPHEQRSDRNEHHERGNGSSLENHDRVHFANREPSRNSLNSWRSRVLENRSLWCSSHTVVH
jgi:hypothetical protein